MADAIWKFHLEADGRMGDYVAKMPAGAVPVSVGSDRGMFAVWAIVNQNEKEMVPHHFFIAATGQDLPSGIRGRQYLGRVEWASPGITYQWHVFDFGPHKPSYGSPLTPESMRGIR